ncbi:MAG: hypothetical protein ACYSU7_18080 [Planctomycetota bacterium]|jgi:hypothetical protein
MNREHVGTGGAAAWAACVALGVAHAVPDPCANDAGPGNVAEGEACLVDHDDDTVNGGCNSDPVVFVTLATADFINGVADICGSASNYDLNAACDTDADCDAGESCVDGECQGGDEPSVNRRDTDWYLIPVSVLADHDTDGNGVVGIRSSFAGAELEMVTFLIGLTDPAGGCDADVLEEVGCSALGEDAEQALVITDHLDGVVVFAAPGECSGAGIYDGFECSTGNNDYILRIEFWEPPVACQPGPPQGPCGQASGGPGEAGCEDPRCCSLVCQEPGFEFCCTFFWSQGCADRAIDIGCAVDCGASPVIMATGGGYTIDGYLVVGPDAYGAWTDPSFGGTPFGSDRYNPISAGDELEIVSFSNGFFLFIRDTNQRELLASSVDWQNLVGPDDSLDREVTESLVPTDTNDDCAADHMTSQFEVTGVGVDLTFDLEQWVASPGAAIATLNQVYTVTNNLATPIAFVLLRHFDGNLVWQSGTFSDDWVGTTTNSPVIGRSVFFQEPNIAATTITLSSPQLTAYVGAKRGVNPDPSDPDCPAYGDGTDLQAWDAYGLPDCWRNHVANVGYGINGVSGSEPGDDARIAMEIAVSLPAGPGSSAAVEITFFYGQPYTVDPDMCPWDCQAVPDGEVNIADFLAILAQWGQIGTSCDFDGAGVSITDFLHFLANFGPCP